VDETVICEVASFLHEKVQPIKKIK